MRCDSDVGQHLPTPLIYPNVRKRSTMAWKLIRMIKILQWKYQRKSTKGNNIFIARRFQYKINKSLSKREVKSKWKELDEDEVKLERFSEDQCRPFNTRFALDRPKYCSPQGSTVHSRKHCSPSNVHKRKHCSPVESFSSTRGTF